MLADATPPIENAATKSTAVTVYRMACCDDFIGAALLHHHHTIRRSLAVWCWGKLWGRLIGGETYDCQLRPSSRTSCNTPFRSSSMIDNLLGC